MMDKLNVRDYMTGVGRAARAASRQMAKASTAAKNTALLAMAKAIRESQARLLAANAEDVAEAKANGLDAAMVDRLMLTAKGIETMAQGLEQVAQLADPVGEISDMKRRPSGIQVGKMRVPLGVVGIIYEARPNVTADAAALCLKSGNAAILRGGKEAIRCNQAIAACVRDGLKAAGLPETAVQVIETTDREAVGHLVAMPEYVDVIVPRGGKGLIERISKDARVPVIKHLDGNCHVYIDEFADPTKALNILDNAKTQRLGTCNTAASRFAAAPKRWRWCRKRSPRPRRTTTPSISPRSSPARSSPTSAKPSSTSTNTRRRTRKPSSPRTTPTPCASCAKSIPAR